MKPEALLLPSELMLQLEQMAMVTKRRIRGSMQGKRRSNRLGSSLEFADYRAYTHGDDTRRFDWSVYARTGKPFIKQFMDEQEMQAHVFLDASSSMNFGADGAGHLVEGGPMGHKFEYAKQLAACIGYIVLSSYDRLDATSFSDHNIAKMEMVRGKGSAHRFFHFLQQIEISPSVVNGDANAKLFSNTFLNPLALARQQGMSWIFSDFLAEEGIEETLTYLTAAKQEVVVVQVLHPLECSPQWIGDLRLIDSERRTGKEVAMSRRILEAYEEGVYQYTEGLRQACYDRGITYILARTDTPLKEMILNVFRKTGVIQ